MRAFVRSALVGLLATGADVLVLFLLISGCGLLATQANVPALIVGIGVQYVGNKYFAFENRSRDHLRQGSLFALVEAGTLALNALGFHVLVVHTALSYPMVRVLVTLSVYLGFSFPLWRLVFRDRREGAPVSTRRVSAVDSLLIWPKGTPHDSKQR